MSENSTEKKVVGGLLLRLYFWVQSNLITTALLVILVGMLLYQRLPLYLEGRKMTNRPAPEFALRDDTGKILKLSDYKGKIVLLNFWATWCLPCQAEIPILRSLTEELPAGKFKILAVTSESPGIVRGFLKKHPVNYSILYDPDGTVNYAYKVKVLPSLYFVDRAGQIEEISHGLDFLLKWKLRYKVTGSIF